VLVEACTPDYVGNADELLQLLLLAEATRATGMAGMNDRSSRTHPVVMVVLSVRDNLKVTRAGCSRSCRARGQLLCIYETHWHPVWPVWP
jgi:hypothetical protein